MLAKQQRLSTIVPVPADKRLIVLAEDEPNDAFLMRRALSRLNLEGQLVYCENGEEVCSKLLDCRDQCPVLCILDIKMPRMNGFETLRWIRQKPEFATMPVVIMSASGEPTDIDLALRLGASDYIVKPSTLAGLYAVVQGLATRWGLY